MSSRSATDGSRSGCRLRAQPALDLIAQAGREDGLGDDRVHRLRRSLDLAGLLGEFRRLFPDVTVVITAGPRHEPVTGVADGDLDIAFAAEGDQAPEGTRFQPLLADEPLLAVVAPDDPLARRNRVSLAEIAGLRPCVEFRPGTELRRHVDGAFTRSEAPLPAARALHDVASRRDELRREFA
jgi:DNA-binding transcriptional LysR family regulator